MMSKLFFVLNLCNQNNDYDDIITIFAFYIGRPLACCTYGLGLDPILPIYHVLGVSQRMSLLGGAVYKGPKVRSWVSLLI